VHEHRVHIKTILKTYNNAGVSKFQKNEDIQRISHDHKANKVEISNKNITRKLSRTRKLLNKPKQRKGQLRHIAN